MYVLLGSNGNITSKTADLLLVQGAAVRVVGRNARSLAALEARGAETAAVDVADAEALARALEGATGVYAMIPTDYAAPDLAADQDRTGEAIASAIRSAGVRRVVSLSSIGAHLPAGTGPIAGLHRQEQRLDDLHGIDVLHLRPGYFFENHLAAIEMIAATGAYADMTSSEARLPMVATADIAQMVARELSAPTGAGRRVRHLRAARLYSMREAAAVLGRAIDQPNLPYVQVDPQQGKRALVQLGFSASAAAQFAEMSAAFSTGLLDGEHEQGPTDIAPTTLEHFALAVFKPAFEARARS